MKRLFALLLCLAMALSLIPAAAAEDIEIVEIDPTGAGVPDDLPVGPIIVEHPKSVTAYVGTTANFSVSTFGVDSYQWYYRTSADGAWKKSTAESAKTAELSVVAESYRSGYQYCCKVTLDGVSRTSTAATLTVSVKPVITTQPASKSAAPGTTAKFTVKADGADSYQWYYRTSSSGSWAKSTAAGAQTATLSIAAETRRSGYQYRCKLTNVKGSVYTEAATLTVGVKPTVTTQPLSYTAGAGATIYFKVKGTDADSYQWYYRTSSSGNWAKSSLTGSQTATLTVKATEARSGYQYRCRLTSPVGSTYSDAATLTVSTQQCGDSLTWKLSSSGLLTIGGTGSMYGFERADETAWYAYSDQIKNAVIGSGVTCIGKMAFSGCSRMTKVTIPDSVRVIEEYAFYETPGMKTFEVADSSKYYASEDGVLFNKSKTELIQYPCGRSGSYTIPNTVSKIENGAFAYCRGLTGVTIPSSVASIGELAFDTCSSLKSISIPSSVTSIGVAAFYECSALKSISIPSSVTSIEAYTFIYCSSLSSVKIPVSVTRIEAAAFYECPTLSDVYYRGTKTQWSKIFIDETNDSLLNATIHYNYTG